MRAGIDITTPYDCDGLQTKRRDMNGSRNCHVS